VHAGFCDKRDQHFETELFPFACNQIGNQRLTYAENFGGRGLGKFLVIDDAKMDFFITYSNTTSG